MISQIALSQQQRLNSDLSKFKLSQVISSAERVERSRSEVILKDLSVMHGRIGILGGSFDPVQLGHLESALSAMKMLNLNTVVFLPTPQNPLKDKPLFNTHERLEMLIRTVQPFADIFISDFEIEDLNNREGGEIRTIETVERLFNNKQADSKFVLLFGVDLLFNLHKWERYHELFKYAEIAPLGREVEDNMAILDSLRCGFTDQERRILLGNFVPVDLEATCFSGLSSTIVREKLKRGESVIDYIAPEAYQFLLERSESLTRPYFW